jgi:hypothetical protein
VWRDVEKEVNWFLVSFGCDAARSMVNIEFEVKEDDVVAQFCSFPC